MSLFLSIVNESLVLCNDMSKFEFSNIFIPHLRIELLFAAEDIVSRNIDPSVGPNISNIVPIPIDVFSHSVIIGKDGSGEFKIFATCQSGKSFTSSCDNRVCNVDIYFSFMCTECKYRR